MILVTGATGLIGSHLICHLLQNGEKIRALKRETSDLKNFREIFSWYFPDKNPDKEPIEWFTGDVSDIFSIEEALTNISTVYHCAGFISFHNSDAAKLMKINAEGTANLINAMLDKKHIRLCHVSSVAALNLKRNKKTIDEDSVWQSDSRNSAYAISKFRGEHEVWRGVAEGLNAIVVNPSFIVGPGNWHNGSAQIAEKCHKGIGFYTDGITGFVDVRDVCKSMIALMKKNPHNGRFILNAENLSFKTFLTYFHHSLGRKPPAFRAGKFSLYCGLIFESILAALTNKPKRLSKAIIRSLTEQNYYDNQKIIREIGIEFISIKMAVDYTCEKYLKHLKS